MEGIKLLKDTPGSKVTTFGLGGLIREIYEPGDIGQLVSLLKVLREEGRTYRLLGAGSNLLIPDEGISDAVIRLGRGFNALHIQSARPQNQEELEEVLKSAARGLEASSEHEEETTILAFAGVALMSLSRATCNAGLSGLEFAAGIPASLGGAIRMNAGAHGHEMSGICNGVWALEAGLEFCRPKFHYRGSDLSPQSTVVAAELKLKRSSRAEILELRNSCLEYRKNTQPLSLPSAGSVFRNPEGQSAGALLERAGLSGVEQGGVCYSELHCNWLIKINEKGSAEAARDLMSLGESRVKEEFGINLKREIICW